MEEGRHHMDNAIRELLGNDAASLGTLTADAVVERLGLEGNEEARRLVLREAETILRATGAIPATTRFGAKDDDKVVLVVDYSFDWHPLFRAVPGVRLEQTEWALLDVCFVDGVLRASIEPSQYPFPFSNQGTTPRRIDTFASRAPASQAKRES